MAIPFWIINLNQQRLDAMEARWSSPLTQAQLNNPWQQVKLDGKALPGLWHLREVERELKAQVNKKQGADGGATTLRGLLNPNMMMEGELYIPSHFSAWVDIAAGLDVVGDPTKRAQHPIEHPLPALAGVTSVLVLKLKYIAPQDGGPLRVVLGVLGTNERDGATKHPSAPTQSKLPPAPSVPLTPGSRAPNLADRYKITPPRPAR